MGVIKVYFFFFQAEDGIRDYKVTGVQTCALPISRVVRAAVPGAAVVLQVLDGVDAPDQRDGELAERRPDEIELPQGERAPDLRRLLSLEPGVDGQLALALERDALAVQAAGEDHPAQQLSELLGREPDVGVADRGAVGREDAYGL